MTGAGPWPSERGESPPDEERDGRRRGRRTRRRRSCAGGPARHGSSVRVCLAGASCEERYHLHCGEAVAFELEVEPREDLDDFVFGVGIKTPRGVDCWGTNTDLAGYEPRLLRGPVRVRLVCPELRLAPGEYTVDLAVHARDGRAYDYRRRAFRFTVAESSAVRSIGLYLPHHEWRVEALGAGGNDDGATDQQAAIDWRSPAQ